MVRDPIDGETIRELVLTWPVRQLRGFSIPPPRNGGVGDPEWRWKHEQRHGAPKVEARYTSLELQLGILAGKGRNVEAIIAALREIKGIHLDSALHGLQLDSQRQDADEAEMIRLNLSKWLRRAVLLHKQLNPDDLRKGRRFRRRYEEMLTGLTFKKVMTDDERAERDWLFFPRPAGMERRRARRGNPDGPIVDRAYDLLAALEVTRKQALPLLSAIGLLTEKGTLPKRGNFSRP